MSKIDKRIEALKYITDKLVDIRDYLVKSEQTDDYLTLYETAELLDDSECFVTAEVKPLELFDALLLDITTELVGEQELKKCI
jgi:hypothetical protein